MEHNYNVTSLYYYFASCMHLIYCFNKTSIISIIILLVILFTIGYYSIYIVIKIPPVEHPAEPGPIYIQGAQLLPINCDNSIYIVVIYIYSGLMGHVYCINTMGGTWVALCTVYCYSFYYVLLYYFKLQRTSPATKFTKATQAKIIKN